MTGFQTFITWLYTQGGTTIVPAIFLLMLGIGAIVWMMGNKDRGLGMIGSAVGGALLYYLAQPVALTMLAAMPRSG